MAAVRWVVFDYGDVLSESTPALSTLARVVGVGESPFAAAYWAEREAYDRGLADLEYWRRVVDGAGARLDEPLAARLTELDTQGWSHTVPEALALVRELRAAGVSLALLSNAPAAFARHLEKQDWIGAFDHLIVSGDLGYAKPDAAIWAELLSRIESAPQAVLFLDDKPTNVAGAREAGLHAEVWRGARQARLMLTEHGPLAP